MFSDLDTYEYTSIVSQHIVGCWLGPCEFPILLRSIMITIWNHLPDWLKQLL